MTQKFDSLATQDTITKTEKALAEHNFLPETVATGAVALARIKELIPAGASVMNGSSRTMEQIGLVDYLSSGNHEWNNLHDAVLAEKDEAKQKLLRTQAVVSDFYLGSAHAVTEDGRLVIASNTGSQLPHLVYTSPNIILVVSTKKIVPTLADAMVRIQEQIIPHEDERMKQKYGSGTNWAKTLVLNNEATWTGRKIHVIFVNENLGF